MSRFWNPSVRDLSPYQPGEQPKVRDLVKLNTNELPHGCSPRALEAIRAASTEQLCRYPDPESSALRGAWARFRGVTEAQVFCGNGSDEVLAHAFRALCQNTAPLLFPDISYSFYPVFARLYGLAFKVIPLAEDFRIRVEDYFQPNGGIIITNPNAPTGVALELAAVRQLLSGNPDTVVMVDEAYVDFGADSAVSLIDEFPNLLVIQTLSKSHGLAGLRVGAALGDAALIEGLTRVKNSFNSYPIDRLAEAGAIAALDDRVWFERSCASIVQSRDALGKALTELGFEVLPSRANFLFARHPGHEARGLFEGLRRRGVLVRHFDMPRIRDYLRISVGSPEECETLQRVLTELVQAQQGPAG